MQITARKTEGLTHGYDVVVPAAELEKAVAAELERVGKSAKIAGFRPGKVPAKVIKQRYGSEVEADVVKRLITDGVTKTITDNKLRPALQPKLDKQEHESGKDLAYGFTVEVLPDVPDVDLKKITINKPTFEITDADVEGGLKKLADRSKEPKTKGKGAKAGKGDVVKMDFTGYVKGEKFPGGEAKDFIIEIGSGNLIAGFEDQLIGLKAGDEKKVEVTFPDNYFSKDLAGTPATFDVLVIDVCELATPAIDDAFAKTKGYETLDALKEKLKEVMKREFDGIARAVQKRELFDVLEKHCTYPIPQGMVDIEFGAIWQRVEEAKAQGDKELAKKSDEQLKEEYTKIAKRRVSLGIYLAELGRKQNLQVTREELARAMFQHAGNFPGQEQRVVEFYRKHPEALDELRGPILEDKAVDYVFSQVTLKDKPTTIEQLEKEDEEAGAV